jgi:predicted metal-dependent peptidase
MPETVHLLYWDAVVAAHEEYNAGAVSMLVHSTKPKGGGGTAPSCVPAYLQEKNITPDVIVMFTDGYVSGDWGSNWPAPLMWVVHNNKRAMASHGITVHIGD